MPPIVAIADDLTGATEIGLEFRPTRQVTVALSSEAQQELQNDFLGDRSLTVVETGSRNVEASVAKARVSKAVQAVGAGSPLWLKKIDSTIRGNVAAEISALLKATGAKICIVCPANPESGRIVVGGHVLLHGVPVNRTSMAQDPLSPVTLSSLVELMQNSAQEEQFHVRHFDLSTVTRGVDVLRTELKQLLESEGPYVVVADATQEADLQALVSAAWMGASESKKILLTGSGGMARAVATTLPEPAEAVPGPSLDTRQGPILVVSGSVQPLTAKQLERLFAEPKAGAVEYSKDMVEADISKARSLVVRDVETAYQLLGNKDLTFSGLIACGGDVSRALLERFDSTHLTVIDRVDISVPFCTITNGLLKGIPFVSKAGALGSEEAFAKSVERIMSANAIVQAELPILALTIGDPTGVGPEIVAKTILDENTRKICRMLVIGSAEVLNKAIEAIGLKGLTAVSVSSPEEAKYLLGVADCYCPFEVDHSKLIMGQVCPEGGRCAVEQVLLATDLAMAETVGGIVTAPLNKEAMHKAGFIYGGHTELLAERSGAKSSKLCLSSRDLSVVHATCHVPFRDIPKVMAKPGQISTTIKMARDFIITRDGGSQGIIGKEPRVAVGGINPHCEAIFGDEEKTIIAPALEEARTKFGCSQVFGPIPGDTVFMRAKNGEFDIVVALYHDLGHAVMKLSGLSDTVNVTLGLPIIRTSVDHGTAHDIAGKGIADPLNMIVATEMAAKMANEKVTP